MNLKRSLIIYTILAPFSLFPQSFYERIMEQNVSVADSSSDVLTLERGASALIRLSKNSNGDWQALYHAALSQARAGDLLMKKDTLGAKARLSFAHKTLDEADSLEKGNAESTVLRNYILTNELRSKKADPAKIEAFGKELAVLQTKYPENPRIQTLLAFYYLTFYSKDKKKVQSAKTILQQAQKNYSQQKRNGYRPYWGKKWNAGLQAAAAKIK